MTSKSVLSVCAAVALAVSASSAWAADGSRQSCVRLNQIDQSPAVDDRTILLEMKAGGYKRVDLMGPCVGLTMSGFVHQTPSDDLCINDTLQVKQAGGSICKISQIVDLNEADAKLLKAKR
jgi:hypothetical protein